MAATAHRESRTSDLAMGRFSPRRALAMSLRPTAAPVVLITCFFTLAWQSPASSQDIEIEITEVPYQEVYAFGSPWFDFGGGHDVAGDAQTVDAGFAGFGFRIWGAREDRDIQLQLAVGFNQYRVEDLNITDLRTVSVFDMMWGGRYFPRYPTFGLGRSLAARATFFAEGGLAMGFNPDMFAPTVVFGGGLSFSGRQNPGGVMLEIVYRPLTQDLEHETDSGFPTYITTKYPLTLDPAWSVRFSFVIAP
jgi:hypothetical protein